MSFLVQKASEVRLVVREVAATNLEMFPGRLGGQMRQARSRSTSGAPWAGSQYLLQLPVPPLICCNESLTGQLDGLTGRGRGEEGKMGNLVDKTAFLRGAT